MTSIQKFRLHQIIGLGGGCLGSIFWVYTFYFISSVEGLDRSGFKWMAEVPLTAIWLFLCVPAFCLSFSERTVWFASGFAVASIAAFGYVWPQLLFELGVH